ncbi:MAG: flagellar export protein FliJ [Firmicutes bacterium]|nr:flagellar export protein FliJ [Bacillota bacterium]
MKKFRFRLATVLKVSQIKKEQAEINFAEATNFLLQQMQSLAECENELSQGMQNYYNMENQSVTIDKLTSYGTYFDRMRNQIQRQQQAIVDAEENKREKLEILQVAMSKLKTIEQLRDKRFEEYQKEQIFEEQKELDEIGLQIYTRMAR